MGPALTAHTEFKGLRSECVNANVPPRFVPPICFGDCLVSTGVTSNGGHNSQVVLNENLFHHLDCFKVA